ncbi:uncharacterized protein JCM6883_003023 [Sporobolomyces salmoneus]|uniref:uncharacterized protein n=1 Tax=Sporobolomyces salmoneus TaxID=183962 RepID=UPI00317B1E21
MAPTQVHFLRWPRFIFFQLTQTLSLATAGLAIWALVDGRHKQALTRKMIPGGSLHINDAIGTGAGVTSATGLCGLLCFGLGLYTIFGKRRVETLHTIRMKEGLFAVCLLLLIAALVPATLFCARRSGVITAPGIPPALILQLVKAAGQELAYSKQTPIVAYVITGWCTFATTFVCLILVSLAARKEKHHHETHYNSAVDNHDAHSVREDEYMSQTKTNGSLQKNHF